MAKADYSHRLKFDSPSAKPYYLIIESPNESDGTKAMLMEQRVYIENMLWNFLRWKSLSGLGYRDCMWIIRQKYRHRGRKHLYGDIMAHLQGYFWTFSPTLAHQLGLLCGLSMIDIISKRQEDSDLIRAYTPALIEWLNETRKLRSARKFRSFNEMQLKAGPRIDFDMWEHYMREYGIWDSYCAKSIRLRERYLSA